MTDPEYYAFMKKRGELLKAVIESNLTQLEQKSPEKAKAWLRKHSAKINQQAKRAVFGPGLVPVEERASAAQEE